jgi:hypothetical protein
MLATEHAAVLLEAAEQAGGSAAREVIGSLVRQGLTDDGWRALGPRLVALLDLPPGGPDRAQAVRLLASLPLRSARQRLHELAVDPADPEQALAHRLLTESQETEADRVSRLLAELPTDPAGAAEALARLPLERYDIPTASLEAAWRSDDVEQVFWAALALGRTGRLNAIDRLMALLRDDMSPRFMWGDPWTAYDRIAEVRPVPEALRAHLLQLERPELRRDPCLLIWAVTGTRDAEGSPLAAVPGGQLA